MFVSSKKYNRDIAKLKTELGDLRSVVVEIVGGKTYTKAVEKLQKKGFLNDEHSLENFPLEFEDLENPVLRDESKTQLPPRSEYNERLEEAIKLFQKKHTRSDVERLLRVSRKTARKYLNIAISKRKVKKADYDTLNQ